MANFEACCETITIQKMDVCSRWKYPKTPYTLPYSALHSEWEYILHFEIQATFHVLFQIFQIFLNLLLNFFVYSPLSQKITQPLQRWKQKHRSGKVRRICFLTAAAEQNRLKMKNGGHLEAAELKSWIRQAASSFWGFLCRTKVFFVNRD